MADEQQPTEDASASTEAIVNVEVNVEATADRLTEIASQSLDTNEVARQIEELTSVVLDSAEVSTRSASVAADVSATMRAVVSKIQENNIRNVTHSRIMLAAFCTCLLIAMGIFFAITMKMTQSIKELDTMIYAMAKRVIEVDASLNAIGKTNSNFSEITDKQDEVITTQTQVAKRLEELGKSVAAMPTVVAAEANKSSDLRLKDMQKQLTMLDSKLQSFDGKLQTVAEKASSRLPPPAPAPVVQQGPSTQVLLTEIQKIKSDLNAAVQVRERTQTAAEASAIKSIEKTIEKATVAASDAQKAADKAALSAKTASESQKAAAASEKASAAERLAQQKAAAERAVVMRMQPEKPVKSAEQIAEEKAAAERAAAARAAKAAADKAAADKAAAAERAAAEKARVAAAAAANVPPPVVREKPIQYPRVPD
jgi:septal ring factor EnvC (AmiA/AmiB activator)